MNSSTINPNTLLTLGLTLRGTDVFDFVHKLPSLIKSIRVLHFKTYCPSPTLEERLAAKTAQPLDSIFEEATQLRRATKANLLSYWESVLIAAASTDKSQLFVHEALKHEAKDEANDRFQLTVEELEAGGLRDKIRNLSQDEVIALYSKCVLDDRTVMHIPMMDFRALPNQQTLSVIKTALEEIHQLHGVILESGRSYHFYGLQLLGENDWMNFMLKCLLLAPFTDARYITHRLLERVGSLRITAGKTFKPNVPTIVDVF
jgi:hypothetical protein